jgi:hypothetical protein
MAKQKRTGVIADFDLIQKAIKKNARADSVTELLRSFGRANLIYLSQLQRQPLTTSIPNKHYFSFVNGKMKSRAVNENLFQDSASIDKFLKAVHAKQIANELSREAITRACYTLAVSLACTVDLENPGDKQTPGTYFQYLVTHLLTREFNCDPAERVKVKIGKETLSLTMDLVLNLGVRKPNYHVAIKNSSRERASEVWTHQRILDRAFRVKKYIGLFVGLAESKLDHRNDVVTEICVPDQWRAYQQFVSRINTIYYLDPPTAYLNLNAKEPLITVKPFGDFFFDGWPHNDS